MKNLYLSAAIASLAFAGAANASVYMSFADPIPGRQLHNTANDVSILDAIRPSTLPPRGRPGDLPPGGGPRFDRPVFRRCVSIAE